MDVLSIVERIEQSGLGEWMRASLKALPIVESIHVMAVAVVFGTILIVDLRLLGFLDARRPYTRVSGELLHFTWAAFVVAAVTGGMMFAANAMTYFENTPFRLKMLALVAAGVNMAVFQLFTSRNAAEWESDRRTPAAARTAAVISLVLWTSVIFLGRWIGFTKGYAFEVPEDLDLDFDFLESAVRYLRDAVTET